MAGKKGEGGVGNFDVKLESCTTFEEKKYNLGPCETIIDGVVYDLSGFTNHPGGETALSWAFQRDATALFRSYHVWNDAPRKMLEKYRKKEQPPTLAADLALAQSSEEWKDAKETLSGWDFDGEFGKDVLKMVREHFAGRTHFASNRRLAIICVLMLVLIYTIYHWFLGTWWSCLAFPIMGWVVGVNTLHDASHRAMSAKPWVNDAWMLFALPFTSPIMWYHQHVIGHHAAPNTRHDPDLRHGLRFWRYHPLYPFRWWHKYQLSYFLYLWAFSVFALALMWDYFTVRDGVYRRTVALKGLNLRNHLIERAYVVLFIFVSPFFCLELHQAIFWGLSWYLVIGVIFAAISQVNHVSSEVLLVFDRSWHRHQVITAVNYGLDSTLTFYITGGLNFQIEHHLFPGVNNEHLPGLSKKVRELCEKHNVKYPCEKTYFRALLAHLDVIFDMSMGPEKSTKME